MTRVALLRAVNVGGTGKLAMADLARLCEQAGLRRPRTYIQSGNVVFDSDAAEDVVKATLEAALAAHVGKPVGVVVRDADALDRVVADNPFPGEPPSRVIVMFYDAAVPPSVVAATPTPGGERLVAHDREIYVLYPNGQGASKLKAPHADRGTGRNLNTVAKLAALARER